MANCANSFRPTVMPGYAAVGTELRTAFAHISVPRKQVGEEDQAPVPTYASVASTTLHGPLFRKVFRLLRDTLVHHVTRPAFHPFTSAQLDSLFPFKLGSNGVCCDDALIELLAKVIQLTPRLAHPLSLSSHSNGLDPYGIVAEFIACVMSAPVVSYYFAPIYTLMEEELKTRLCVLCGWTEDSGIFCPSDAVANLMTLRMAIHHFLPQSRQLGLTSVDTRPAIFMSAHAHLDWENASAITGLGSEACCRVATDADGRMCVAALRLEITRVVKLGLRPFMVVATAGTPNFGAIDPINEIADLCQEIGLWLHVDGAFGAAYLLTEGHTGRLSGVSRCDSLSWSPSGMLGAPTCSTILVTSHTALPGTTFRLHAQVVYKETSLYDGKWDNGDSHIQTCRRPDVLKPWLMWKTKGQDGLAAQIKYADDLTQWTLAQLKARPNFHSILKVADTPRVVFYFQSTYQSMISTRKIAQAIQKDGIFDLDVVSHHNQTDCFSIALNNPLLTRTHVTYVLDIIEYYGTGGIGSHPKLVAKDLPVGPDPGFWDDLFELILDRGIFFQTAKARAQAAFNFQKPEDLMELFNFHLEARGKTQAEVLEMLDQIIRFSLHQSHPNFRKQLLSAGLDPYAIMADLVTSVASSPMLGSKDSAVYRRMEEEVIRATRKKLGFTDEGDGMITPGGSLAVITAIHAARAIKFPKTMISGQFETRLVLFMSENGHYSNQKAAILQGLGLENAILVKTDESGKIIPAELVKAIYHCRAEGGTPFMVTATAGTTGSGVFDPLEVIARICEQENLWLHVDASLGGSFMFSDHMTAKYLQGIQRADSISFNPHKMFGCPLEISILLFKRKGVLEQSFSAKGGNYSSGFQSDRRPNIFKFWFLWKAKGACGLGKHVDHIYRVALFGADNLKRRSDCFILWKFPLETPALLFQYVPLQLRNLDRTSTEFQEAVNKVAFPLMTLLTRLGVMNIGTHREPTGVVVNKMVVMSSGLWPQDISALLDLIDHHGKLLDCSIDDNHLKNKKETSYNDTYNGNSRNRKILSSKTETV